MDTPATESNQPLSISQAASLFGGGDEPEKEPAAEVKTPAATAEPEKEEVVADDADAVDDASEEEPKKYTIKVDGKDVEVSEAELAEAYKSGLRQADYTKKTMEVSEQRKAAEAESAKARDERQKAQQGLTQAQAVLEAQLAEQKKIDWHQLRESDPLEFVEQWHLFQERQANLQRVFQGREQLGQQERADAKKALTDHLKREHQATLDKLPEWKDEKKATAEKQAIVKELIDRGFEPERIFGEQDSDGTPKPENPGLTDHRILLMARDAMLYRQMMSKAQAAAKKVSALPQKVERPGGGETNPTDGRTSAMKRLGQEKSVRAAAAVLDGIFK